MRTTLRDDLSIGVQLIYCHNLFVEDAPRSFRAAADLPKSRERVGLAILARLARKLDDTVLDKG